MWKDITSYSQGDKKRNPTTFEAKEGLLRIVITCGHIYYKPKWVMHCKIIEIDTHELKESVTKEQAEVEAIQVVTKRLNDLAKCAANLMSKVK